MVREQLEGDFDRLTAGILSLGRDVDVALALVERNLEGYGDCAADHCLRGGARFKERAARLDEECMILQVRQAPVACDLRLLHAVRAAADHMMRASVLCEQALRALAETSGHPQSADLDETLVRMARRTHALFRQGLWAFEHRDAGRARDLETLDDEIDLLYFEMMALSVSSSPYNELFCGREPSCGQLVRAALLAHYLERIADHGVGIGRRTVFATIGEQM